MKKKILFTLVVTGVLGGAFAYMEYTKKHRDIEGEQAALSIRAPELFKAYVDDEAAANAQYLDKVLEVKGIVADVDVSKEGGVLLLQADDDFFGVNVYFDSPEQLNKVRVGNHVTIKGHCTGGDNLGVVITHSSLIRNSIK